MKIKLIDGGKMPEYKSKDASCADCYARLATPFVTILKGSSEFLSELERLLKEYAI